MKHNILFTKTIKHGLTLLLMSVMCACTASSATAPQSPPPAQGTTNDTRNHTTPAPSQDAPPRQEMVMCTQEVMQCTNGRWVGRSGPRCEFNCTE